MKLQEIQEAQKKKKHKTGKKGQARGTDKAKTSKPSKQGSQPHPFRGKLVGEDQTFQEKSRIQHVEDLIFWEGSQGALRGLEALKSLEEGNNNNLSLKFDGSPGIYFGRNQEGEFIFTDKGNFLKKNEEKPKNSKELESILTRRITKNGESLENHSKYKVFVTRMKNAFEEFQKAIPKDFHGYFVGDMLYFEKPEIKNNKFVFKPNVVEYAIDVDSDLGEKIENSEVGVVIHKKIDHRGHSKEPDQDDLEIFDKTNIFAVPPVNVKQSPALPQERVQTLEKTIQKNTESIDDLLNSATLRQNQLTDFPKILYNYLNSRVDTGLSGLSNDFFEWLENYSKITDKKKSRLFEYVNKHKNVFDVLWQIVETTMIVKDSVIDQLDSQEGKIEQIIEGRTGGEGYVLKHSLGDVKLVPRQTFTRINRKNNSHN